MMKTPPSLKQPQRRQAGFTLVELLVVVLIIGILAAVAVPQYFKVVEKGRFAEATSCAANLTGSEERYFLKNNAYTGTQSQLDIANGANVCTMKYFSAAIAVNANATYTVTFTRINNPPPVYGAYTFTYTAGNNTQPAYAAGNASVTQDLLP